MIRHSLTWEKTEHDPTRHRDYLTFALVRSGVCAMLQDSGGDYQYIANLPTVWRSPDLAESPSDISIFGQELGDRLMKEKRTILDSGHKREFEWEDNRGHTYHFLIELVLDRQDGRQIFTTVNDLTDERRREKTLRTLLKEVSHRSKNLMAIIQSVASQTARHAPSLERFVESFRGRLQSLSLSQDTIMDTDWQGSSLKSLINRQVGLYPVTVKKHIKYEGSDVILSPNATVHIGLALHELLSNAVDYGTFLDRGADVVISAQLQQLDSPQTILTIEWDEPRKGEADDENGFHREKRFGTTILERVVPSAVGGQADFDHSDTHIRYRISFPAHA